MNKAEMVEAIKENTKEQRELLNEAEEVYGDDKHWAVKRRRAKWMALEELCRDLGIEVDYDND